MKVSILIPVYGVESYIGKCAHSLMKQTYQDIEYIFWDDCTTDKSLSILRNVLSDYPEREQQVRVLNNENNQGVGATRQSLVQAATGDAILFVDSDDYVAPNAVETLVEAMQSQKVDIVDGGYYIVTDATVVSKEYPSHKSREKYLKTILCQNVEPNRIWGRLIKRSLFVDNRISFTQGVDYCEDFSVLPRLLLCGSRGWVDELLYYYRDDNPCSYTNNITRKNAISFVKAQQIVGDFMASSNQWRKYHFAAELGWVNVWRFARRFGIDTQLVAEYFKKEPSCCLTRLLSSLMRSHVPYELVNYLYLITRRVYLMSQF